MILNAIAQKLKRQSKDDFKGRHFEAWLIVQAVTWYLRYPLSYRDLEEMFRERGFEVDHSTINRWPPPMHLSSRSGCASSAHRIVVPSELTRPTSRSGANGVTCTAPSTSMETRSTSCSPQSATFMPRSVSSETCSRTSRSSRRERSVPMAPTPFPRRSRRPSMMDICTRSRSIMLLSICSKASRATTSG